MIVLMMTLLLGMAGVAVDVGGAYVSYRELQASTDAAALAGGYVLPNANATTVATNYSGVSGAKNAYANLPGVTMVSGYPKTECLTTLTNAPYNMPCTAPANANAIAVRQKVTVATHFAKLFGFGSFQIGASATASMRGGGGAQYNVVILVDTTSSMNNSDADPGSTCRSTRISCALQGIRTLLSDQYFYPCPSSQSTCGAATNGNVAHPFDRVGIMTFPGLTNSNQVPYEYCGDTTPAPQIQTYNNSPIYQIVPFSSDYRTSDSSTSLNTNSNLVLASAGSRTCAGLDVIGGVGTFYAGVINTAQAALVAAQQSYPTTLNAMIILSDGDANASASNMGTGATSYPHTQECHQAITAANAAKSAGTRVYTVAYGTQASGTCSTDTSPTITACQTMQQMASSAATFFSDGGSSTNACASAARPTTDLNQIFYEIAQDLTVARIIPDNTT
jgi:hypothetical protein